LTIDVEGTIQAYGRPVARVWRFSVRETVVLSWARPTNRTPSLPVNRARCSFGMWSLRSSRLKSTSYTFSRSTKALIAVLAEEAQHARDALEGRHVDVEVEPVDAFHLQRHVIMEDRRHGLRYAHRRLRLDGVPCGPLTA